MVKARQLFTGQVHHGPFFSDGDILCLYPGGGYMGRNYLCGGDRMCRNSSNLRPDHHFYVHCTSAKNKECQVDQENKKSFEPASSHFPN